MSDQGRRQFLTGSLVLAGLSLCSGCGVLPLPWQQAAKVPRIGLLDASSASATSARWDGFRQGLAEFGYLEGENIAVESRYADGQLDRLDELADEIVRLPVDVIVTGGPLATRAARKATDTLPIVMTLDNDPVGAGFIASLARPGGNITGMSTISPEIGGKRLELLKGVDPGLSRVAVLGSLATPGTAPALREMEVAARALGVQLQYLDVQDPTDIATAFQAAAAGRAEAVLVLFSAVLSVQRPQIVRLAAEGGLPTMSESGRFALDGGLMTYGPNSPDLARRAVAYVDKILKGAKPADLPVQQPTKFDFIINLKTAQALGLTIPQSLLLQASELIQ